MVTQISKMVDQLQSLDGVLATTTELVTSKDIGMGNIGRLREVTDAEWLISRHGIGLSTSTSAGGVGAFLQRISGVTDEAGWLDVLAAPRIGDPAAATVLLGGRPATETSAAEPSAFRSWTAPGGPAWSGPGRNAAREALDILGDVAEGTATWRTVWDDFEAALPPSVTAADLRGLRMARAVADRLVRLWRRSERRAAAELTHAHAVADCAWSREGRFVVKRRTDRRRLTRKLHAVRAKQRHRMHAPFSVQHRWLCSVLRGHYLYYGLPSNWHPMNGFYQELRRGWYRALRRRS